MTKSIQHRAADPAGPQAESSAQAQQDSKVTDAPTKAEIESLKAKIERQEQMQVELRSTLAALALQHQLEQAEHQHADGADEADPVARDLFKGPGTGPLDDELAAVLAEETPEQATVEPAAVLSTFPDTAEPDTKPKELQALEKEVLAHRKKIHDALKAYDVLYARGKEIGMECSPQSLSWSASSNSGPRPRGMFGPATARVPMYSSFANNSGSRKPIPNLAERFSRQMSGRPPLAPRITTSHSPPTSFYGPHSSWTRPLLSGRPSIPRAQQVPQPPPFFGLYQQGLRPVAPPQPYPTSALAQPPIFPTTMFPTSQAFQGFSSSQDSSFRNGQQIGGHQQFQGLAADPSGARYARYSQGLGEPAQQEVGQFDNQGRPMPFLPAPGSAGEQGRLEYGF